MGILSKILLTFILCFGLMAGISLALLQHSLGQSYSAIERRELSAHMGRVVQSLEADLAHLQSLTRDWSVWTDMYNYVRQPDPAWARENIGLQSMEPANLSLVMVYNGNGEPVSMDTRNRQGGTLTLPHLLTGPYADWFKEVSKESRCGLMNSDAGLMLMCKANITRSDSSGDLVGSVVLGRLLDNYFISKLREQTRLPFNVQAGQTMPPGLTQWSGTVTPGPLGGGDFWTQHEPNVYHLYYGLQDLLGKNIGKIALDVSREVHEEGEKLFSQMRRQLLWTALVTAILLTLVVHLMLIRRLRQFTTELVQLTQISNWGARIRIAGRDELGTLSDKVNTLLGVIESQMETLETLTITDALTGLSNRRAFDTRLALEYARSQREQQPLAMLMLDVDHFKRYNDHYGHPGGDAALQALAQVLQLSVCRASDLVARLGGEEFAVLAPETDAAGATALAERVRATLRERAIAHADSPVGPLMTVSIGIALAVVDQETPSAFVQRADQALYRAKHNGRDRAFCDAVDSMLTGR